MAQAHQDGTDWFSYSRKPYTLQSVSPNLYHLQILQPASPEIVLEGVVTWEGWDTYYLSSFSCWAMGEFGLRNMDLSLKRCLGNGFGPKKILLHDTERE